MNSFRNRVLVLIVGLVIVTQTVTFFAVAARTQRDVQARAAEQLRSGGSVVQQFMHIRSGQLAAAAAVLAGDFGLRSAVASGEASTMLSAVRNHSTRIGADLVLLIGTDGRILASTAEHSTGHEASLVQLLAQHGLVDEYRLMVFPILLGEGKRLFGDLEVAPLLHLHAMQTIGTDGIVVLTYRPRAG